MKKGIIIGIIVIAGVFGGIFTVTSLVKGSVGAGKVGVVYSMKGGVQDELLQQGFNLVSPFEKVKEFTIGNEQLVLSKDGKEDGEENEQFNVATSDDASISISFQMSYRYKEDEVVNTYKKFKGMDGEDIVEKRVKPVLKSKISEITSNYSMMEIYSGNRSEINEKITKYLNDELSSEYGIEVLDASIIDVHPDKELKKAIDSRVKALQQTQKAKADQEKIKIQKETELMKAKVDAEIKITKAKATAKSNKIVSESINQKLIDMKEAEARLEHGWVTTYGADAVVKEQ